MKPPNRQTVGLTLSHPSPRQLVPVSRTLSGFASPYRRTPRREVAVRHSISQGPDDSGTASEPFAFKQMHQHETMAV